VLRLKKTAASEYRTGLFVIYAYVEKFRDIKSFLKPYLQKMEINMVY